MSPALTYYVITLLVYMGCNAMMVLGLNLQFGQAAILNLTCKIQIIAALGLFEFDLRLLDLAVDDANGIDGRFFILPLSFKLIGALFKIA